MVTTPSDLHRSHRLLAERLAGTRSSPDQVRDWFDAEEILVRDRAYFLSHRRAVPDQLRDWLLAKNSVTWADWVETKLADCRIAGVPRPYLAVAAARDRELLAGRLTEISHVGPQVATAAFVAVLDGAPEYARYRLARRHERNGSPLLSDLDSKDGIFFEFCRQTLATYHGRIVEGGAVCSWNETIADERTFQDGCIGMFRGGTAACDAVNVAIQLRRSLTSMNYRREFAWQDELHPRIGVASSWDMGLRAVLHAHRDDVVVEDALFWPMNLDTKQTLLAAGIRLTTERVR
jgi:hypothetical protein